ncbi:MAG: mannosyltransferase [Bacteroidota bacterium]
MFSYWKLHKIPILLALVSSVLYGVFGYNVAREDFITLICLFAALFFLYFKIIQFEKWNVPFLLVSGILFRLIFLLAEPNLSQDFYRFIWDGELTTLGINPYQYTPDELINNATLQLPNAEILHRGMGELSARHYSNYPPVNQLLFALSAFLSMGSLKVALVIMRLLILLADLGIVYFGRKLLQQLNLSTHFVFWYFLNPLVIIELSGNLHFEGVMFFLFIWAFYLISKGKHLWAAPVYAAAIFLKLVPLLFLPLFLPLLGMKKSIAFYLVLGSSSFLLLFPLYSTELIDNYSQTLGLWFSNFEFNAGFYNLTKQLAVTYFEAKPWELIKDYGLLLKLYTALFILLVTFFKPNHTIQEVLRSILLILSCYYLFSATVHPWYVIFLIGLSIFTTYRYPLVWSGMVIVSYFAYSQPDFQENLWVLFFEYSVVIGFIAYEFIKNKDYLSLIRQK